MQKWWGEQSNKRYKEYRPMQELNTKTKWKHNKKNLRWKHK